MGRGASLDADQARRQLLEERQNVSTLQLTANDHCALRINAMNLKDRFRDVETDCRDRLHDLAPPNRGASNSAHIFGARAPGGGAVHSINSRHSSGHRFAPLWANSRHQRLERSFFRLLRQSNLALQSIM